jgi:toxic protein SymE
MADTHHKPETHTPTTTASGSQSHYYKVGYRPNKGQPNPLPQLTIKGRWLEALGFTTGQKIEVITGPGQLIIRLATEGYRTDL